MLVHETNQPPTSFNDPGDATGQIAQWVIAQCNAVQNHAQASRHQKRLADDSGISPQGGFPFSARFHAGWLCGRLTRDIQPMLFMFKETERRLKLSFLLRVCCGFRFQGGYFCTWRTFVTMTRAWAPAATPSAWEAGRKSRYRMTDLPWGMASALELDEKKHISSRRRRMFPLVSIQTREPQTS